MEDDIDELPESDYSKATMIVFNKTNHGKSGFLQSSKFVDLIEIFGEGFSSEKLADRLRKLYPNESASLKCFAFVRWYVDREVSLEFSKGCRTFFWVGAER